MARKREEWISANEAAAILTANTDHEISADYVRMLARLGKIEYRERNERENEYLKSDVAKYQVRRKHAPRVRPRPSTRKSTPREKAIA
jgi:hypothetical protein